MGNKQLNLRQQKWIVMWNEWLNDNLCEPLEQLCTYDNEMTAHGHLHFFESFEDKEKLNSYLNVLYDELPKDFSKNLKKAYLIYQKYNKALASGKTYMPIEEENLFLEVDEFYYNNELLVYDNFIDYVVSIESYIKNYRNMNS